MVSSLHLLSFLFPPHKARSTTASCLSCHLFSKAGHSFLILSHGKVTKVQLRHGASQAAEQTQRNGSRRALPSKVPSLRHSPYLSQWIIFSWRGVKENNFKLLLRSSYWASPSSFEFGHQRNNLGNKTGKRRRKRSPDSSCTKALQWRFNLSVLKVHFSGL